MPENDTRNARLKSNTCFPARNLPVFALVLLVVATVANLGCNRQSLSNSADSRAGGRADMSRSEEMAKVMAPGEMSTADTDELNELPQFDTEAYDHIVENDFLRVLDNPQSTFSIDVDTASYSNVRRFLSGSQLPPAGAVRIEELINYFSYDYPQPNGPHPFSVNVDLADCPWAPQHQLVRVALQGKHMHRQERPDSNLVFLLDVSGSMSDANKLPLVQDAMRMLVEQLNENDRIAIVVYAGASGLVLPSTNAASRSKIVRAIEDLEAGGSTNGADGIELAYEIAEQNFIEGGTNRVILCTDGDFNVGTTSRSELVKLIEEKAKSNVFLSVFGFGSGNYKDAVMEQLADKGNGNYGYIDSPLEAKKALVRQMSATLVTIAKDVKIQVDFNPRRVAAYRLIGYENRMLENQDFNDDQKDAGEIGAGHSVTALYEIVPAKPGDSTDSAETEFVETVTKPEAGTDRIMKVALRYKQPESDRSELFEEWLVQPVDQQLAPMNGEFKFAAAVAMYGMLLRESSHAGAATWDRVVSLAENNLGEDYDGFRSEFVGLVKKARLLSE